MSGSISGVKTFQEIDWTSLADRPPIDKAHLCTEKNWSSPVPCCMDGYAIEHVIDTGNVNRHEGSSALEFLETYPCLNGVELDHFFEVFSGPNRDVRSKVDQTIPKPPEPDQLEGRPGQNFYEDIGNYLFQLMDDGSQLMLSLLRRIRGV